jgi:hypothetical protein
MVGPGAGAAGTTIDEVALLPAAFAPAAHYSATGLPGLVTEPVLAPLTGVKAGDVLTLTPGTWDASITNVTDTWQRCDSVGACQALPGVPANATSYTPTAADAGFTIQVREQATNAAGSVVDFTDATDPVALPDGSLPADPPVLPPGTDPDVPAPVTDPVTPVADPATTAPAASPDTTVPTVTPLAPAAPGTSPARPSTRASACAVRLRRWRGWSARVRGVGRVRITLPPRSRTLVVRAPRKGLRRVEWKIDRRARRHHRAGAVTRIRLPRLAKGRHRIAVRLRPRRHHVRSKTVRLRLSASC